MLKKIILKVLRFLHQQSSYVEITLIAIAIGVSVQVTRNALKYLKAKNKVRDRYYFEDRILWQEWQIL